MKYFTSFSGTQRWDRPWSTPRIVIPASRANGHRRLIMYTWMGHVAREVMYQETRPADTYSSHRSKPGSGWRRWPFWLCAVREVSNKIMVTDLPWASSVWAGLRTSKQSCGIQNPLDSEDTVWLGRSSCCEELGGVALWPWGVLKPWHVAE